MLLEGLCTIFGLVQGVLVAINKRSNWIFYVMQMGGLLIFSLINHLYGDAVNSLIYLIIGVVGFIRWSQEDKSQITACDAIQRVDYAITIVVATSIAFYVLRKTNDPLPFLDAFTSVSSFVATYFMVTKKLDAWIIWFVNDVFYVIEYFLLPDQAIMLAVLNMIWTGLAVYSFFNWRRLMKEGESV